MRLIANRRGDPCGRVLVGKFADFFEGLHTILHVYCLKIDFNLSISTIKSICFFNRLFREFYSFFILFAEKWAQR
jgi:hypothetical protein